MHSTSSIRILHVEKKITDGTSEMQKKTKSCNKMMRLWKNRNNDSTYLTIIMIS